MDTGLPAEVSRVVGRCGTHILAGQDPVVTVEGSPCLHDLDVRRVTLRRLSGFDRLTKREREVAVALASGRSAKEVARHFGVAPATVRNQTQSIYGKLSVENRAGLVAALSAFGV